MVNRNIQFTKQYPPKHYQMQQSLLCLVIDRNLDTALAFKYCRPDLRGGLKNETVSKKGGHRYFIKWAKSWSPRRADHSRDGTQSKHINEVCEFPQLLCHQGHTKVRTHFPLYTVETGARCFWTQDIHALHTRNRSWGVSLNTQVFLNYSSSWVSQLLGICKRTKCRSSPLPFSSQSNYVAWPYWAYMPKRICTRPQNSRFCMKLMGQMETCREVMDNRLEYHAISFSAETEAHLDSTGR